MPKPPFRRGLDPLYRVGLVTEVTDELVKFFWFCEGLYLENQRLRNLLEKHAISLEENASVRQPTPGSPGRHRKVFDEWYDRIASDLQVKNAARAFQRTRKTRGQPN